MTLPGGVRVGLIELSTSVALSVEAPRAMPDGATAVLSRLRFSGGVDAAALEAMVAGSALEEAATLLADAGVSSLAFACTTGSLLHGRGYDTQLAARLGEATGLPATTTATSLIRALTALGARKVVVGTPYVPDLDARERAFLQAQGFEVLAIEGLGLTRDETIAAVSGTEVDRLAERVWDPAADAMFLSCTNLLTLDRLDGLERRFGVPVISSNAVTIWDVLRLAGVTPGRPGLGSLLAGTTDVPSPRTTGDPVHVR